MGTFFYLGSHVAFKKVKSRFQRKWVVLDVELTALSPPLSMYRVTVWSRLRADTSVSSSSIFVCLFVCF